MSQRYFIPMKSLLPICYLIVVILLIACSSEEKETYDLIITNADVYPVVGKSDFDAIAVKDGKINLLSKSEVLKPKLAFAKKHIDAKGNFVMPGFIEGHGHLSYLGRGLENLNFLADTSWQQITEKVGEAVKNKKPGEWIYGRGWHQEKWNIAPEQGVDKYPSHNSISKLTPDNPTLLIHASGHSCFANQKAMELLGVNIETPDPEGGKIIRNSKGLPIGIFEERAMDQFRSTYQEELANVSPEKRKETWIRQIKLAEQECLSKGITSFQDAGAKFFELNWYEEMARNNNLDMRLWVMVRDSLHHLEGDVSQFKMENVGDGFYTCKAIKSELDGALGAHGAWLLEEYDDKPGFHGHNTTTLAQVENIADQAYKHDMQLCVHAIGDKANRKTLDIFEAYKNKNPDRDLRWRVEHAQHLHPDDIPRFKEIGAIACMQGIHCTSDAPFVEERLGPQRAKEGAYAWRALLDAGAVVVNGTDAPVEDANPLANFYATVTRKRTKPDMEFFPEQKMTREEAIYSYTLAAAYAGFEEEYKGSIEIGKYGDLVILDKNLINCSEEEILDAQILYTIVGGEVKFVGE